MINKHIVFIGFGNMAKAILGGLFESGTVHPDNVTIIKKNPGGTVKNIRTFTHLDDIPVINHSIILLCVKPQVFAEVGVECKKIVGRDNLILSVMAGVGSDTLAGVFGDNQSYIRCMPNTPALLLKGFTAYWVKDGGNESYIGDVRTILNGIGISKRVDSEDMVNWAAALSGSGPGYYFYFAEAMIQTAIRVGFTETDAKTMIAQTFSGAASLLEEKKGDALTLRKQVTSKGGMTEAALNYFKERRFSDIVAGAIGKGYDRSIEISKKK